MRPTTAVSDRPGSHETFIIVIVSACLPTSTATLTEDEVQKLRWIFAVSFEEEMVKKETSLIVDPTTSFFVEIGPR